MACSACPANPPERQTRTIAADFGGGFVAEDFLEGAGFHELAHPQAAGITCGFLRGQGVVGADHLIAVGHVSTWSKEQRAVIGQVSQEPVVPVGHHLNMFGSDTICLQQHLIVAVADDDFPVVLPRLAGNVGGRELFQQPFHFAERLFGKLERVRQQDGRGGDAVFGLAQQIRGAHFRVNRVIGNHQRFRRTGKQIDTYPAEQLSFGLRDEGVTGADQHVDRCQRVRAQRHGAYRLNAAKGIDSVAPAIFCAATIAGAG